MTDSAKIETVKYEAPDAYMSLKYKGPNEAEATDHQVFMSAGLLRRLVGMAQSVQDITEIYANPYIQEILIVETLTPRSDRGTEKAKYTLDDFEMTPKDGSKLMAWIAGHITSFFTEAVENIKTAVSEKGNLTTLTESVNGLVDLAEKKQSAGHSTAS